MTSTDNTTALFLFSLSTLHVSLDVSDQGNDVLMLAFKV